MMTGLPTAEPVLVRLSHVYTLVQNKLRRAAAEHKRLAGRLTSGKSVRLTPFTG